MLDKMKRWIERYQLLMPGDQVLVACSGGADSLALLHSLYRLRSTYQITIAVVHVDHMFRGEASALDAAFVADFSKKLALPCYQKAINVPEFIAHSHYSAQEAARILRYEYLREVANHIGGAKIATGHHRDDQAETVLIHLLRGSGSEGLGGIKPENAGIIRPLLDISRLEIESYCEQQGLTPRLDATNLKTKYVRNRIRLKLLPEIEKEYNCAIKETLGRTARILAEEHDFIQSMAKECWLTVVSQPEGHESVCIDTKALGKLHRALQREIFRLAIEKKQGSLKGITFYHVERLIEVTLTGTVGTVVELPGGLLARKSYVSLELGAVRHEEGMRYIDPPDIELVVPGITVIPHLHCWVEASLVDVTPKVGAANEAVFDWETLSAPLIVRKRTQGDRFYPLGMQGSKKLKEFFIDAKVDKVERERTLIFCDAQEIIWVGGYRQAQRGKVTKNTVKFLKLSIKAGGLDYGKYDE